MVVGHGTSKSCCFCLDSCLANKKNSNGEDAATEVDKKKTNNDILLLDRIPNKVMQEHRVLSEKMFPNKNGANGHVWKRPHDVEKEHQRIIKLHQNPKMNSVDNTRVKIMSMHKVFPASGGNPEKMAVKCVSFGVQSKECFGLLGHNGAGKTTLLNMLTGLYPATSGTTFVDGLRLDKDMSLIYAKMGVCPQHDILWESLTGRHHIQFFGRLKGLSGAVLESETDTVLRSVNLSGSGDRKAGGYSGGMKRRLSVANSLIGNPDVVYMDEPSTGLDPASKHQLWDVISASKAGKSMILTTHSMEEADVLCDRIAIMAGGELQCIGRSWQLKRRFGKGYTATITSMNKTKEHAVTIENYMKSLFVQEGQDVSTSSCQLLEDSIGGVSKFEISRNDVVLSKVFQKLNSDMVELEISDWGITETTLEEVFLKLAALAELFHDKTFKSEAMSLDDIDGALNGQLIGGMQKEHFDGGDGGDVEKNQEKLTNDDILNWGDSKETKE